MLSFFLLVIAPALEEPPELLPVVEMIEAKYEAPPLVGPVWENLPPVDPYLEHAEVKVLTAEIEAEREEEARLAAEAEKRAQEEAERAAAEAARAEEERAERERAEAQRAQDDVPASTGVPEPWSSLADCESGEWVNGGESFVKGSARWDYGINFTHAGYEQYEGGLNFHSGTWDSYRDPGMPDHAGLATPAQQIEVGKRVQADQGFAAWPRCSRMIGLR